MGGWGRSEDAGDGELAAALDSLIEQLAREFDDYQKPLRAIQKVLREIQA